MFEEMEEPLMMIRPYAENLNKGLDRICGIIRAGECYMSKARRQKARDKRKKKKGNR